MTQVSTSTRVPTRAPLRVAVVSPYPLVRAGLADFMGEDPDRAVVVDAAATDRAGSPCDVVVLDLAALCDVSHRALVQVLLEQVQVLGITRSAQADLAHGAALLGVVDTVPDTVTGAELRRAVADLVDRGRPGDRDDAPGEPPRRRRRLGDRGPTEGAPLDSLTDRELEVVQLIAVGLSNQQIATRLHLSINTVKTYVRTAYRHSGVAGRSEAVVWAARHGLVASRRP